MNDDPRHPNEPEWLDEFRELANRELPEGSSCEQVHPIVERWYRQMLEREPPAGSDSIDQAMACLATEILNEAPDELIDALAEHIDEDLIADWVVFTLMVGRAFEASLRDGGLDDL